MRRWRRGISLTLPPCLNKLNETSRATSRLGVTYVRYRYVSRLTSFGDVRVAGKRTTTLFSILESRSTLAAIKMPRQHPPFVLCSPMTTTTTSLLLSFVVAVEEIGETSVANRQLDDQSDESVESVAALEKNSPRRAVNRDYDCFAFQTNENKGTFRTCVIFTYR